MVDRGEIVAITTEIQQTKNKSIKGNQCIASRWREQTFGWRVNLKMPHVLIWD